MKSTRTLVVVACFVVSLLMLSACNGEKTGDIPVNKERAKVHVIPIKEADAFRRAFGTATDSLRRLLGNSSFLDSNFQLPVAEMFNRDAIALLLNQKDADGIRIYLGRDGKGQVRLVLLPVDKNGNDIRKVLLDDKALTQKAAAQAGGDPLDGEAVEVGQRCPTACSTTDQDPL